MLCLFAFSGMFRGTDYGEFEFMSHFVASRPKQSEKDKHIGDSQNGGDKLVSCYKICHHHNDNH